MHFRQARDEFGVSGCRAAEIDHSSQSARIATDKRLRIQP